MREEETSIAMLHKYAQSKVSKNVQRDFVSYRESYFFERGG